MTSYNNLRCPICGENVREIYRNRIVVVQCRRCGVGFRPELDKAVIRDYYNSIEECYKNTDTVKSSKEEFLSRLDKFEQKHPFKMNLLNTVMKLKDSGKLLEIGCGTGVVLKAAKEYGYDVKGIEPGVLQSEYAKSRLGNGIITNSMYKREAYKKGNFDIILMQQVLEHMSNPNEVLDIIHYHLKDNGIVAIEVPSVNNPKILLYKVIKIRKICKNDFIPTHIFYYSLKSLRYLLHKHNFTCVYARTGFYSLKIRDYLHSLSFLFKPIDFIANSFGVGSILIIGKKKS